MFVDKPVPFELVKQVIEAGTWAPSAKNGQQWRFTVVTGEAKDRFVAAFRTGLQETMIRIGEKNMGSSFNSCSIMDKAPVIIVVWNTYKNKWESEIHSVAAAIQNMLLMAYSLGLGSLWIADVFYAHDEITKHFGKTWRLTAAITLGWPAESERAKPPPRRLGVDEVSEFLE